MQVKFLKSVVENLVNKQAVPIIDLLIDKKNVNEFLIAKKLNLTINQTRNILYKLSDFGLVSFIRKKDKRKGWYIYFWTLNTYQSLNLLLQNLNNELNQLETQLKSRQEKRYYFCNTCNLEVSEESALMNDFTCSECENIYQLSEKTEVIDKLEKEILRVKKEIDLVNSEIQLEGDKLTKKKNVKIKRQEREAKENRRKKKEERIKLAKKLDKKATKEKESKKPAKATKETKSKISKTTKKK